MRIILDENLPADLRRALKPRDVTTAQFAGFSGMENGDLLKAIDEEYDLLITADKNLRYQQNLTHRAISIIELPTNRWPLLRPLVPKIINAVNTCAPGGYLIVEF